MRVLLTTLALIAFIAFSSCEGRKTKNQALLESVEQFNTDVTFQMDIYHPETYMERKVDTLLSNGYHIKINLFSEMNKSVVISEIKDTINYNHHHRNFKFNILIKKEGQTIYNKQFDKTLVNTLFRYDTVTKSNIKDYDFDKLGVLKSIELSDNPVNSKDIKIDVMYTIPNTNRASLHTLSINDEGILTVKRIEIN